MKQLLLGLGTITLIPVLIIFICFTTLIVVYGFGWLMGWLLNFVVGPSMLFGITFPQFFGLMSVFASMVGGSITPILFKK